jgi:hypothetical protein
MVIMNKSEPQKVSCQTLLECVEDLKKVLSPSELEKFTTTPRDKLIRFHFSLGLYIRNRYLYEMPLLRKLEAIFSLIDADNISGLVVDMLWLSLNQVPCSQIELDKLLERQFFLLDTDLSNEEKMKIFCWE